MVTVLKRGAAPVDPISGYVDTHKVYEAHGEVWDAMLNQTNIGWNSNKFYVIQLLHPLHDASSCLLFTHWGRVGERGQKTSKGPFPASVAVNEFKKQFKSKTATNWESRRGMVPPKGKYTWIERSFEEDDDNAAAGSSKKGDDKPVSIPDSTLSSEVQTVCKLIFNQSLIQAHLSSMNYDANKLPLGKLARSTILSGFSALKVLSDIVGNPNSAASTARGGFARACRDLTENYYSIIPHVFGRSRPVVIDNMEILKRELDLVDALGDMEIAQKLIQSSIHTGSDGKPINPLDSQFRSLQLSSMEPVDPMSAEFAALAAYTADSHGATHSSLQVKIMHAYRVERQSETDAWKNAGFDKLGNGQRLLLWHGSRTTNFAGILRQGLRIAPPEAPVNGYMFGKGVYFADMVSKSAGYCHAQLSNNTGLLLLCEVAARPTFEQYSANYQADQDCKRAGKMTTHGLGRWQPTKWKDAGSALDNAALKGCHMPDGPASDVSIGSSKPYGLFYNEYIAYNPAQIRLRYMLLFKNDSQYPY
ncbi:PARP-domain-containing protein [Amylostereum chailletii]|nr:PARP-domain-containing protein [Amylostereum chailletii]